MVEMLLSPCSRVLTQNFVLMSSKMSNFKDTLMVLIFAGIDFADVAVLDKIRQNFYLRKM